MNEHKYTMPLADDDSGAYTLMRDGREVGTILFYEDAVRVMSGLKDVATVDMATLERLAGLRGEVEKLGAYNVQYITERNEARQEVAQLEEELARAQRRVAELTQQEAHWKALHDQQVKQLWQHNDVVGELGKQVRHWKANHDDLVKRNALLSQRPDLPVDRVPAHAELRALQAASVLYADAMSTRKALDIIDRDGMGVHGYVLQGDAGKGACIIHRGAVRWLGDAELYVLIHPAQPELD